MIGTSAWGRVWSPAPIWEPDIHAMAAHSAQDRTSPRAHEGGKWAFARLVPPSLGAKANLD
jgi:hypothetical protein